MTTGGGSLALGPPTVLSARQAGPNVVSVQQGVLSLDGAVTGTGTITVNVVDHADGSENIAATWTCSCTAGGQAGTIVGRFVGDDANLSFDGTFTLQGEDGLAGLRAHGTFSGSDLTGLGSYSIAYVH